MRYLFSKVDKKMFDLIRAEDKRQEETLMMIPSENYASRAVEEALSSRLGNKYAEGYPFRRYYQGQKFIDLVESLTIERAKKLFGVPYVNVQPLSGAPANSAVYFGLLKPGQKIMGLALAHGGHLTHGGLAINFAGTFYQGTTYFLERDGWLNYDKLEKKVLEEKPDLIVAGITAYARALDFKRFAQIAQKVNAILMADIAHLAGLVLAGAYPDPVPYCHVVTTTTHKTLRGPRGALIMVTEKGLKKDPEMGEKIDKAVFPGLQGGPHENTIAGIGVALHEASTARFKKYAFQIIKNCKKLAEVLVKRGYNVLTGGTDCHLILVDLQNKGVIGNTAAEACEAAGIVLNRNGVPYDPNPSYYPSGIRLGTPGLTSRKMKEKEMADIGNWICDIIDEVAEIKRRLKFGFEEEKKRANRELIIKKSKKIKEILPKVRKLCKRFPIPDVY